MDTKKSAQNIREKLLEALPPIVTRKTASELTGNFITPKTMANLDSLNQGPARKFFIGRQVGYTREDFIDFLMERFRTEKLQEVSA